MRAFEAVVAAAADSAALGLGPGEVVAVVLPNRVELVIELYATWRLGAALTPVNPALTQEEAPYQLADAGARVAVVDAGTRELVRIIKSVGCRRDLGSRVGDGDLVRVDPEPTA